MLYVLVNNDYHFHALQRHGGAALGGSQGTALILVPHVLASDIDTRGFRAVYHFETPLGRSRMPFLLWHYGAMAHAVVRALKPGPQDTLLFFTEMERLNHIVAQCFRRSGARIVMMQDGGVATYVHMSMPESEPLTLREHCVQALYRLVPGLHGSRPFKINGLLLPRLPDAAIDEIALYHNVPLQRRIPTRRVQQPARKSFQPRLSTVIFLNQPLYDYYQGGEVYLTGLWRLMVMLSHGFKTVYFKFHPRETEGWRSRIRETLAQGFPEIKVIERSDKLGDIILDYKPEVLASYLSAGILSLEYDGIEPLFLYHLIDDLMDQPLFESTTRVLKAWGYHFVRDNDEIRSGYRSGLNSVASANADDLEMLLSPAGRRSLVGHSGI